MRSGVRFKTMTYKIDIYRFLVWYSALLGEGKNVLAQCQDNVNEWDIGSGYCQSDFLVGQHYKVTMSVRFNKSVRVLI